MAYKFFCPNCKQESRLVKHLSIDYTSDVTDIHCRMKDGEATGAFIKTDIPKEMEVGNRYYTCLHCGQVFDASEIPLMVNTTNIEIIDDDSDDDSAFSE